MFLLMFQQLDAMEVMWLFLLEVSIMMMLWGDGAVKIRIGDKFF
jgi:hypothetical protein